MDAVEATKNLLLNLGTAWILYLLAGLSLVSLAVALERWLSYRALEGDLPALAARLDAWLGRNAHDEAIAELERSPALAGRIAAAGLRLAPRGPEAVARAMESRTALERTRLERRLAFLGTLGNNAPFIGLFGTVVGIIAAFEELGHGAPGHGVDAASQVASQGVMSAIAEALVATAIGILVALPAVAAYNYLQRRVATLLEGAHVLSKLVVAYLSDSSTAAEDDHGR